MRKINEKDCGVCVSCRDRNRWIKTYWEPYIAHGGDKKWAKEQIKMDATLTCRNPQKIKDQRLEIESEMLYNKAFEDQI